MFKKNFRQDNGVAYLLLAPIVILLTIFVIIPFFYALRVSFYNWSFYQDSTFVGLQNFYMVLTDDLFLQSIWVGLKFALMVVPTMLILSFLFANIIKNLGSGFASVVKTSVYIPTIISGIVASVIFVLSSIMPAA